MPLKNIVLIAFTAVASLLCYETAQRNRYAATITEAIGIIEREFIEEVEARDLFEDAMEGMVEGLDQYSGFISRADFSEFQESLDQNFGGVGIIVELDAKANRLTVMSPLVDTPAFRAGVQAGDTVLEIDGVTTEGMSLRDAVGLMRGPPGAPVTVKLLRRNGKELEVTMRRAVIPIQSVKGDRQQANGNWVFHLESHPEIGYVRVSSFGEKTVEELQNALRFEQGPVKGIILDLRNNAGGLLTAAVDTCDMFIQQGKIVTTRGRNGSERRREIATAGTTIVSPDIPLVVLVNHYSASASEIVAACLQDHQRCVIVGERTWGKGTVQNLIELEGGKSALKLTTATYWRPSGKNIHRSRDATEEDPWGVSPNPGMEVKLTDEEALAIAKRRQQRDILPSSDAPEVKQPPEPEPTEEPVIDRQLQKAVEHLWELLEKAPAEAEAA